MRQSYRVLVLVVVSIGLLATGFAGAAMAAPDEDLVQSNNSTVSESAHSGLVESESGTPPIQLSEGTSVQKAWNATYGGPGFDGLSTMQPTPDGGYLLAGYTQSYGSGESDGWLVKVDGTGAEEWNTTYGGPEHDDLVSMQSTADGGYLLGGETESYGSGEYDGWLVKVDDTGAEEWNTTYGGPGNDSLDPIQPTADGGYLLGGETESYGAEKSNGWLVKVDGTGAEEWNTTYGGPDSAYLYVIQPTADSGYLLVGTYGNDGWLVKVDGKGAEEWNATYGGPYPDRLNSMQSTSDDGYLLAGDTESYGSGPYDGWLVKVDDTGAEEWNTTYGGPNRDRLSSIQSTSDGGYLLAGYTESYGYSDGWLVKVDGNGAEEWNTTYGGLDYEVLSSIQPTSDGGYLFAGVTNHGSGSLDGWLLKVKPALSADGPGDISGNGQVATDTDNDGLYEDITGDGKVDARDVLALWNHLNSLQPQYFDFTGEGDVDARDVLWLWNNRNSL